MPWLMKAEPDSRIVKGKDVKFSVDDFEKLGTSQWDGVRSHEARNIMRDKMKLGDQVLFYHSNTKVPGVFALAEVVREGYPDWSAWDPAHPYFDEKTDKDNPTWMMVDVKFVQRLEHPPTLALIKHLASVSDLPESIEYITEDGLKALQAMQLVNRGRLSVQPVTIEAYDAVVQLGTKGGWQDLLPSKGKTKPAKAAEGAEEGEGEISKAKKRGRTKGAGREKKVELSADDPDTGRAAEEEAPKVSVRASAEEETPDPSLRRSKRVKR